MAGRSSQASRRSAASSSAKSARAEVARARRAANKALAPKTSALASLGFIGAGLAGLWMGIAHAIGWVVRAIGRKAATARELDREHQRDGGGLLLIGLGIVLAVAVWFNGAGPFGRFVATYTRLSVGAIAMALPLLLLLGGIWLMREPADDGPRGRGLVGWTALLIASAGLLHLGKNQPIDLTVMDRAGGWLGRASAAGWRSRSRPTSRDVLILLAIFGTLVVTATPINKIRRGCWRSGDILVGAPELSTVEGRSSTSTPSGCPQCAAVAAAPARVGTPTTPEYYEEPLQEAVVVDRRPLSVPASR
jgi:S-DNA-T family DNA segregation ATPase FtsK/SpoIIIE